MKRISKHPQGKSHNGNHTHHHPGEEQHREHTETKNAAEFDQAKALLAYMIQHNTHHAEELDELAEAFPDSLQEEIYEAASSFESANRKLQNVLDQISGNEFPVLEDDHDGCSDHDHYHEHEHGHHHDPQEKKRQINRLSRVIGHLQHVKRLIESDEDCANVLMQISASKSALNGLGKEIINEHLSHCITHAIEDGDTKAVEDFQEAIQKFI